MKAELILFHFLDASAENGQIGPGHISLYLALVKYWAEKDFEDPFPVDRIQVMAWGKINGRSTYQKYIQDLSRYGYIGYNPSCNHSRGSLISMEKFSKEFREFANALGKGGFEAIR